MLPTTQIREQMAELTRDINKLESAARTPSDSLEDNLDTETQIQARKSLLSRLEASLPAAEERDRAHELEARRQQEKRDADAAAAEARTLANEMQAAIEPLAKQAEALLPTLKPKADRLRVLSGIYDDANARLDPNGAPKHLAVPSSGFGAKTSTEAETCIAFALSIMSNHSYPDVILAMAMKDKPEGFGIVQTRPVSYRIEPQPGAIVNEFLDGFNSLSETVETTQESDSTSALHDDILAEQGFSR